MKLALNGWGQSYDGLQEISPDIKSIDYTRHDNFDGLLCELKEIGEVELLIGWSLGGQLAMRAILQGVLRAKKLLLIAPPFQFIACKDFPCGMDPLIYQTFRDNYSNDPARTAARFTALIARGDENEKEIMKRLVDNAAGADSRRWLPWLDALGDYSMKKEMADVFPSTLLIHGRDDAIVPFAQSGYYQACFPHIQVEAWDGTGHAPHWHDGVRFKMRLESFFE